MSESQRSAPETRPAFSAGRGESAPPVIIPPEALEALNRSGVDTSDPEKVAAVLAVTASVSRSPYPLADVLGDYEHFRPGMADLVLDEIRHQTRHRQGLEKMAAEGNERRMDNAQKNALGVAVIGIAVAVALAVWNTPVAIAIAVVAVGGAPVASIVARLIGPPKSD